MLLVDAVGLPGEAHAVAQQREAGQGAVILEGSRARARQAPSPPPLPTRQQRRGQARSEPRGFCEGAVGGPGGPAVPRAEPPSGSVKHPYLVSFVEEQTEIGEDHPQLLPAATVLELPQQVSRELVLEGKEKPVGTGVQEPPAPRQPLLRALSSQGPPGSRCLPRVTPHRLRWLRTDTNAVPFPVL